MPLEEERESLIVAVAYEDPSGAGHRVDGSSAGSERAVREAVTYVAGMTDRYAINLYERLFVPRAWV